MNSPCAPEFFDISLLLSLHTLPDIQRLIAYGLGRPPQEEMRPALGEWNAVSSPEDLGRVGQKDTKALIPSLSVTPASGKAFFVDQRKG